MKLSRMVGRLCYNYYNEQLCVFVNCIDYIYDAMRNENNTISYVKFITRRIYYYILCCL